MVKFMLILLGLAYLISPVDVIPELYLPWVGWIDDSLVIMCLYHLLRYGQLPDFLFKKGKQQSSQEKKQGPGATGAFRQAASHRTSGRNSNRSGAANSSSGQTGKQSFGAAKSPYTVLGVEESASWTEIQKAYKDRVKQYHPDKLSHLGEEFSNLANEKFLEIQQAYAMLKNIYKQK